MKVKFLRSIIAAGEHREAHTTATLDKIEAVHLIRAGDCVEVKEAAEAPTDEDLDEVPKAKPKK